MLFCTGCGLHYHASCLEIGATPIQRAGWQCPECKVCQTCRLVCSFESICTSICDARCSHCFAQFNIMKSDLFYFLFFCSLIIYLHCPNLFCPLLIFPFILFNFRQPGEDTKMLVCDACDKGYHTFCLRPAMDSLPSDPWKCRVNNICFSALSSDIPLTIYF